jgi:3-oxoacyl-[acyl-carrier protein] reductase
VTLAQRVALVTGGGRGIGRGISQALAEAGLAVAVGYHRQAEAAQATAQALAEAGHWARVYAGDVADAGQVERLVAEVLADTGRIDVLVNNAGLATRAGTLDLDQADWERVMGVNVKGAWLCARAVVPSMRRQGWGRIINLTSIAGQTGGMIGPHYAASKAGLMGLTRFMARELAPLGITVNAVAPSGVSSELLSSLGLTPSAQRPVGRVGQPADVAAAVCYLASEGAGYVTGQELSVNGGSFIG